MSVRLARPVPSITITQNLNIALIDSDSRIGDRNQWIKNIKSAIRSYLTSLNYKYQRQRQPVNQHKIHHIDRTAKLLVNEYLYKLPVPYTF